MDTENSFEDLVEKPEPKVELSRDFALATSLLQKAGITFDMAYLWKPGPKANAEKLVFVRNPKNNLIVCLHFDEYHRQLQDVNISDELQNLFRGLPSDDVRPAHERLLQALEDLGFHVGTDYSVEEREQYYVLDLKFTAVTWPK